MLLRVPAASIALITALGCASDPMPAERQYGPARPEAGAEHGVTIHVPEGLGRLALTTGEPNTEPVRVPCATCHGVAGSDPLTTPPPIAQRARTGDKPFHDGVSLDHGQLPCLACHAEAERDRLRLADGSTLAFDEVMTLCAQCHGPQYRDYTHGAHGGMNGYWDLRRGPRERNSCVDCHRPHAPAYRPVMPVLPPRDRWLQAARQSDSKRHQGEPAHGD